MAETVLSFVVEETLARVGSLITEEIMLAWNFQDELKGLQDSLTMIRAVLQDAEEQQTKRQPVRLWLKKLKEVAYEAEDVFDELAYETLRPKVTELNPSFRGIHFLKKVIFNFKLSHKVKKVNQLLRKIKGEAIGFNLEVISGDRIIPHIDLDRLTDSVLDNPVFGREADASKIVNLLTRSCDQQILTVPIVGMGGLGKTALAKLVYQEVIRAKLFDVTMWVCVSEKCDERKILGEMLQSLNASMGGLTNKDAILQQLGKELAGKKFLLVLDDVWEDVSKWWDDLETRLLNICTNNGNVVLITTRSEEVSSIVETSPQHRHTLGFLSDDECWSILKERAFRNVSVQVQSNLEVIGKEIAKKCRGVPLAAKVLGGTLGFNTDEGAWLKIRDSYVLKARHNKENVESILKLSFDHLPSALKSCFAFCSVFPKDLSIRKEELIHLWMAEGFIESSRIDMGNTYFNVLLQNSFLQDVQRNEDGDVTNCKMHDLVHDLALLLSKSETLTKENCSATDDTSCIRYLYADYQSVTKSMNVLKDRTKKLRTIILDDAPIQDSWKLKSLRTLKMNRVDMDSLPLSINELKHLRYLDVSSTKIRALPKSITKLYNLQILKYLYCDCLSELPRKEIKNLTNLKCIAFSYEHQMPFEIGKLTSLETLPFFAVGPEGGGSIQELACLNELGGYMEIRGLENVGDKEEAERANLERKTKIRGLYFNWSEDRPEDSSFNDEEVLEALQPHKNIKKMKIEYYLGDKWPSWFSIMKSPSDGDACAVLNNLVALCLDSCRNCEQLPSLGTLPCLKFLEVDSLERVKRIDNMFYGLDTQGNNNGCLRFFPALKSFSLFRMDDLSEWRAPSLRNKEEDDKMVVFPVLEELLIYNCYKLIQFPMSDMSALVKLEIRHCEELSYVFDELHSFPSLTCLYIQGCSKLISLPKGLLSNTSMKELSIRNCHRLRSIPEDLENLSSLSSLEICWCGELRDFPEEILCKFTQLKRLEVGALSKSLDDFRYLNRIKDLPCLEELKIHGSEWAHSEMSVLQNQLQHLTALKSLKIVGFVGMEALPEWLGDLQSLQSISLLHCIRLKYESTAPIIQRLSNLRYLCIVNCHFLTERKSEWMEFQRATGIKVDVLVE